MDKDRVARKGVQEKILSDYRTGKIDILIGTQMIAKGFDFPNVTLVGVILADTALSLPDFRSAERTFQLLTQVAGRSGRGSKSGKVIIQTYLPDHYAISYSKSQDYNHFFNEEIEKRKEFHYPPHTRMINIMIRGKKEERVIEQSTLIFNLINHLIQSGLKGAEAELLGPAPLPFYRLQGAYRWHVMLKGHQLELLTGLVKQALQELKPKAGVRWAVDVDPLNIL
jgi:primosomal protein N' (replication factor Y)